MLSSHLFAINFDIDIPLDLNCPLFPLFSSIISRLHNQIHKFLKYIKRLKVLHGDTTLGFHEDIRQSQSTTVATHLNLSFQRRDTWSCQSTDSLANRAWLVFNCVSAETICILTGGCQSLLCAIF